MTVTETMTEPVANLPSVAIIGGGPAGLMAAETLSASGLVRVTVYDAMPSPGRKFLLAGRGGLNLTHSEPMAQFVGRYGQRADCIAPMLARLSPQAIREWAHGLGVDTFVGSSGRVFPREMKAAPLLRAWLHRLRGRGVAFRVRHRWTGWQDADGVLTFETPTGTTRVAAHATILALGGASWPRLGSDGRWVAVLAARGIPVRPLLPSNCGFDVAGGWSEHFRKHQAGQPLKSIELRFSGNLGQEIRRRGECVISAQGIEGGAVYAISAELRTALEARGAVTLTVDLMPDWPRARVLTEVARPRGSRSFSSHLQSRLGLKGAKVALLREVLSADEMTNASLVADTLKGLPLTVAAARPIAEAISTAGGVDFGAVDAGLMLRDAAGVFCAGEMLDWDAPTGGYLLTGCLASGCTAADGALAWLKASDGGE